MRKRRSLLAIAIAGIFLIAWPPMAWLAVQPLERGYSETAPSAADAETIVVLSSGILPARGGRPAPIAQSDTYEQCTCAAWLYRIRKHAPVLACGGSSPDEPVPAAHIMRQLLMGLGVPESMIWLEDRSHSTYEDALYAGEILRAKGIRRILLVTEAYHMTRSERCFRKQGFSVLPAPCGFFLLPDSPLEFIPDGNAVLANERTLHEYGELGWYLLRGKI